MIAEAVLAEIGARLEAVRGRIAAAAERAGRAPDSVRLIAVSKRQPLERIAAAAVHGALDLGENYVQETRDKRAAVEALIDEASGVEAFARPPRWHLIGPLQRNKVGTAIELYECIESVDRAKLADALDRRAREAGRRLDILLQVNLSAETQKAGVAPDETAALLAHCARLTGLRVCGLMAIPAASADPEATRPAFAQLRALRDRLREGPGAESLSELSMGMSGDFEVAIEEGATRVRVGTAIFGERAARGTGTA